MRAMQYSRFGDPAEVLELVDLPEPHAGAGEVRVRVVAAGVNPVDWKVVVGDMSRSTAPKAPKVPGVDVAGVVDEVGEGVRDVAVGDEVLGFSRSGALAERAVLREYARVPDGVGLEEAAALPVPVETALRVLELLGVREGQTLLVDNASGGVGVATVQIARSLGARVIGTAGVGNQDLLRALGAEPVPYGHGLVDRVRALAPHGVDAALDAAGKGSVPDLVTLTGDPAAVVTIADFSAGRLGVHVSSGGGEDRSSRLRRAAELVAEGTLSMPVAEVYDLHDDAAAYARSREGHVRGKLVVHVA